MTDNVLTRLRADLDGAVIAPGDPAYDGARKVMAGQVDRRPAVVVRPRDATGVTRVVAAARESGLPLAIRSGGHSAAGHGVCDGGIVLDLSRMKRLDIDPDSRTAWAETGLTAGEYTTEAGKHGLATGFGDTGSVGIGGITLGGGVGFLSRRYGLTIDDLLAAEMVTADGRLLQVDEDHHPDLFWAIRGGGGNFGVATRLRFRLHDVPSVVGGMLMLPATPEVLAAFLAEAEAAPEGLTTIANVLPAPPMPFVPEHAHGSMIIMALLCYAGPAAAGEQVVAAFRNLATPVVDTVAPMPYPQVYGPDDSEGPDQHPSAVIRTSYADALDVDLAAKLIERLQAAGAPMRAAQFRVLGGAISRVAGDATAYAHRQARIMTNVAAFYTTPEEKATGEAWAAETSALLQGDDHGAYVNFLGDDGPDRVRAAYPGDTCNRLVQVKRRYDPANLFRLNHNIPPAQNVLS